MNKLAVGGLGGILGGAPRHPYAPAGLSLPGYVPVARSLGSVLIPFFGVAGAVTAGAWVWAGANGVCTRPGWGLGVCGEAARAVWGEGGGGGRGRGVNGGRHASLSFQQPLLPHQHSQPSRPSSPRLSTPPHTLSGKAKARLSTLERAIVTWLVVTATVHLIVEGESVACVARVGVLRPRGWRGRVERERRECVKGGWG